MAQNGYYVAGHVILPGRDNFEGLSDKILKEGLIVEDSSKGLSHTTRQFGSLFQDCLDNLIDLSKNSSGSVIIISIPKELFSDYDTRYFDSSSTSIVLEFTGEESSRYKDIFGNPTKIALLPSMYILGYLNVYENLFIPNPNYAFNNNKNISSLKLKLDNRYKKIANLHIQKYGQLYFG